MAVSAPPDENILDSFSTKFRKRFQTPLGDALPLISVDRDGTILSTTRAARQMLEHPPDATINDCFFSHVHERHLNRVMHDLANMVCRGKRQAQWLVRLYTGTNRWRWYRMSVQNHLAGAEGCILIRLQSM